MTADIRTAAQRRKFASVEEMMNDPDQRATEVKVAHRYGYWMIESGDEIDTDEIAEADAYLEAHIQHRISEARVTPTREQLDAVARKTLIEFTGTCVCHEAYTSRGKEDPDCVWHAVGDEFPGDLADAILALMQELSSKEDV